MGKPSAADAPIASNFAAGKSPGHPSDPATLDEKVPRPIGGIFPELPQCWGRANSHDRVIVPTDIGAAGSRPRKNRPGFGRQTGEVIATRPCVAAIRGGFDRQPDPREVGNGQTDTRIDAVNAFA